MRSDIAKLICERQRIGSARGSQKTAKKLSLNLDYDDSYDSGPSRVSTSRRKQWEGKSYKSLNDFLTPITGFLRKSIGRSWDDIYSEVCSAVDKRTVGGIHVIGHVLGYVHSAEDAVLVNGVLRSARYNYPITGFYVDPVTNLLCYHKYRPPVKVPQPVTYLHWFDNTWLELLPIPSHSICGCVHFDSFSGKCRHDEKPIKNERWFVVEYGYHDPNAVYRTYTDNQGIVIETIYYRDVPKVLEKPFIIKKYMANRKILKMIRQVINK